MFKKTKGSSARQHARAPTTTATKQKSAGNSKQHSNMKAPTKKVINNQKWPASESGDDMSSDEEPKKRHPRKKTKHGRHEADAEDIEEVKEVGDTEEAEEVEESVGEKVSY